MEDVGIKEDELFNRIEQLLKDEATTYGAHVTLVDKMNMIIRFRTARGSWSLQYVAKPPRKSNG